MADDRYVRDAQSKLDDADREVERLGRELYGSKDTDHSGRVSNKLDSARRLAEQRRHELAVAEQEY